MGWGSAVAQLGVRRSPPSLASGGVGWRRAASGGVGRRRVRGCGLRFGRRTAGRLGAAWRAWGGAGGAAHPSLCSSMLYLVLTYGMASSQPCMGLARRGSGILVTFFQYASCGDRSMVAHDLKLGKV